MHRANRVLRNFFLSLAMSLGLAISLGVAPASAHNSFDSSNPVNGSTLDVAPTTWSLVFKKEVPLASASAELVGSDGVRIALAPPTYGATTNAIVFSLPPNLTGVNTARWRLVGVDGHVITGRVAFTVNALTAPSEPLATVEGAPQSTQTTIQVPQLSVDEYFIEPVPELPRLVFRFINYGALLIFIGLLFVELDIATGVLGLAVAKKTMRIASVLLATSAVLQMMIFSADLSSTSFLGSIGSFSAILKTTPGSMLIMKSIIGCLIGIISFRRKIEQTIHQTSWFIPGLIFLYLITLAYTGHSRSQRWAIFGIAADVVHTAAAGIWLGGLLVLLWVVIPHVSDRQAIQALQRFGSVAKFSVLALIVTGIFQTLRLHDKPVSIFTSNHGQLLLAKLILFLAMLKYADMNRRSLAVRFANVENVNPIKRQVIMASLIETTFGLIVVAVTAVLVTSSLNN
jgi:copper transport protein